MEERGSMDALEAARSEFASWRRGRRRGARIPERLWAKAVAVAQRHGTSRTSQALHLDYYALKRHLEGAGLDAPAPEHRPVEFLELPLSPMPAAAECVIEFEDGQGARLRAELRGSGARELECLVRSLWGGARS